MKWIDTASQERGIGSADQDLIHQHPTGIYPLPAAGLMTGQAYTMPQLGYGDNVNFYERSEQKYEPLQTGISDFLTKHYTNPVATENYFPTPINMLAQPDNLRAEQWNELIGDFPLTSIQEDKLNNRWRHKRGSAIHYPDWVKEHLKNLGKTPREYTDALLLTKQGMLAGEVDQRHPFGESVDVHEWLHIIDSAAGGDRRMSDIMADYMDEKPPDSGGWTEKAPYNRWMNDPETKHLGMEDSTDVSPHSGRNNPREGFGKFLARAFRDPKYNLRNYDDEYKLLPHEIFSRAGASTIKPYGQDEGFTPGLFGDLDRGFANSLATFLNN